MFWNLATLREGPITKWTAKRTIPPPAGFNKLSSLAAKRHHKKAALKVATQEGRGVAFFAQNVDK